jgi:hypothetical protein
VVEDTELTMSRTWTLSMCCAWFLSCHAGVPPVPAPSSLPPPTTQPPKASLDMTTQAAPDMSPLTAQRSGFAGDLRVQIGCSITRKRRLGRVHGDLLNGLIFYWDRSAHRRSLNWRTLDSRWAGQAKPGIDFELCLPLYGDQDGLVADCGYKQWHQLARFPSSAQPILLGGENLRFGKVVHVEALGGGRLVIWLHGATLLGADGHEWVKLAAVEFDEYGAVTRFLPVEDMATVTQILEVEHGVEYDGRDGWPWQLISRDGRLSSEPGPVPRPLPLCPAGTTQVGSAPAALTINRRKPLPAWVTLGNECLLGMHTALSDLSPFVIWAKAENGVLVGRGGFVEDETGAWPKSEYSREYGYDLTCNQSSQ